MSLIGDIIEDAIVRPAVTKAVDGFVAKGQITAAQGPILIEGIMLELQLALEAYQASQAAQAAPVAKAGG